MRQQCNEYIELRGIVAGPEVIYTQTEDDGKNKLHFLHVIADDVNTTADLNNKQQAVTLLYIMSLSLINELSLQSVVLPLMRGLTLRDSLTALKDAIKAVTESDHSAKSATSIKQIFIIATDAAEAAELIAALSGTTSSRSDTTSSERAATTNDETADLDEGTPQMQISLSPTDYDNDSYYGDIYRYLRDNVLPADNERARRTMFRSESMFIGEDNLLYCVSQPRSKKRKKSEQLQVQKVVPSKYVEVLLQYVHLALGHGGVDKTYITLK